ncbi:uncharacterized protein [Procambarus clarkii]|uniref:uncharacterized protein n=1 Tax=Procambarus clarkii TaxID=6728 RepID=UPI001E6775A0|nr:extensin-like [Procambarus clarkii]XP_045583582.1 extensin-like [Procambarus clarkii]XP_045583583.1 extensin-like [Procambarus clarkii]
MGSGSSAHTTEVEAYGDNPYQLEDDDGVATPLRPAYAPSSQPPPTSHPPGHTTFSAGSSCFRDHPQVSWASSHTTTHSLPFQPTPPPPYAHPHMGCYPIEMEAVTGTGVVLSRVVRVLEATPPPYLLLPDHPNIPVSPAHSKRPPPAPPNTAHGRRRHSDISHYPGLSKSQTSSNLVSGHGVCFSTHAAGPPTSPSPS